ncbi:MAG: hypothetical protein HXY41_11400 [Chloroflexi bacterium]|nr:hypothetical protein [Chloroflexota bacterium]
MTRLQEWIFPDEGRPVRWKGALAGVIGGLAGAYALRLYWRQIAPAVFPPEANPAHPDINPARSIALAGRVYQMGESAPAALGRVGYERLAGETPDADMRRRLDDAVPVLLGVVMGITYGGTRTTTRARDLAGGFFYGLRLWLGDTIGVALAGLRPGPAAYSRPQHLWRLIGFWVYSFTTTAVTRLLYRLIEN